VRIAILTTETPHHARFVQATGENGHVVHAYLETKSISPPYDVRHPFETERDEHEWGRWFSGRRTAISDFAPTKSCLDINVPEALKSVSEFEPDLIIVFGTSRIGSAFISLRPNRIVNLHGGDPESYRGLDTHLWAIWHRDFSQLVTTLHRLDPELDNGEIIGQRQIGIRPKMQLHELRAANTEACIALTRDALAELEDRRDFRSRPQRQKGRYYSAMPTTLKEVCVRRFAQFTGNLK